MYLMFYSFDMIMAGLLIVIGICLILIALLVLRFTIIFTMEEQYQEIGILKAMGLRNRAIRRIYLIKYFVIVSAGALLGLCFSIPVSAMMIESVAQNMIMKQQESNMAVNILCAALIVILVVGFCYLCTRRLRCLSIITAIRNGENGERFQKRKGIALYKQLRMKVSIYLGLNDIFSHIKRYAVLIVTFCISFILITIPLNTLNTMNSDEMHIKFMVDPSSSVLVRKLELENEDKYTNVTQLNTAIQRLQQELKQAGYDAQISAQPIYFLKFSDVEDMHNQTIMTLQLNQIKQFEDYEAGSAPVNANEVAFSKKIMNEYDWQIGDMIHASINGSTQSLLITGCYTDYMQRGKSARLNPKINMEQEVLFDYRSLLVYTDSTLSQQDMAEALNAQLPTYEWLTSADMVEQSIGGIQSSLSALLLPMTAMLAGVIMLITLLMEKLFITREKGEIAMLKSIGFSNHTIQSWQLARMSFVVLTSLLISIPLSLISNYVALKPIFALMGAELNIQVDPLQAYLVYPGVLLAGILIATGIAATGIRKIHMKEINNLE